MKANELRIGNWVNYPASGQNLQIESAKGLDLAYCYEPIPLTPDILEKAGFEKCEPDGWYKLKFKSGSCLDLFDGNPFHYADGNFSPDIQYVHTLQNIVYFLTGEELTINL